MCPNLGECWAHGVATFMILGRVCTRGCRYCAVSKGRPPVLDREEPRRVAEAVRQMGPEACRGHLRGPGRPGGRRRLHLRRDDRGHSRAAPRVRGRSPDPRFPGGRGGAQNRCWTRVPTSSTTTSRQCPGSFPWPGAEATTNDLWTSCSTPGGISPETVDQDRHDAGFGRARVGGVAGHGGPGQTAGQHPDAGDST